MICLQNQCLEISVMYDLLSYTKIYKHTMYYKRQDDLSEYELCTCLQKWHVFPALLGVNKWTRLSTIDFFNKYVLICLISYSVGCLVMQWTCVPCTCVPYVHTTVYTLRHNNWLLDRLLKEERREMVVLRLLVYTRCVTGWGNIVLQQRPEQSPN
jgi:hypothetical protein